MDCPYYTDEELAELEKVLEWIRKQCDLGYYDIADIVEIP